VTQSVYGLSHLRDVATPHRNALGFRVMADAFAAELGLAPA
jgi:hypothetical protein